MMNQITRLILCKIIDALAMLQWEVCCLTTSHCHNMHHQRSTAAQDRLMTAFAHWR